MMGKLEALEWPKEFDLTSLWFPSPEGRFPKPLFRATVRQVEAPVFDGVAVAKTDAVGEGPTPQAAIDAACEACSKRWVARQAEIEYNRNRRAQPVKIDLDLDF